MRCKVTVDTSHYPKEGPWELPEGWGWLSGNDIFLPMESTSPKGDFFNYIDIDAIDNVKNLIKAPKHIPVKDAPSRASRKVCRGDVLFSMVRPYLRNIALVEQENCIASTGFYICHCSGLLDSKYCFYLMLSDYVVDGLNQFMKGDNSPSINNSHITSWLYPIPPLAEQKRISQAIEHLLIYTDCIDDAEAYLGEQIIEIKAKILDFAIHGKLVPQDSSDEPAIELLKRINPSFTPSHNLHYEGDFPNGWVLASLGEVSNYGHCISVPVEKIGNDDWVLELEDIEKDTGRILQRLSKKDRKISGIRHQFKKGQILYSKLRTYLNKVLIADEDGFCSTEIIPITPIDGVNALFLIIVLRSQYFLDYTQNCCYGVKMPRLGTNDAKKAFIPLPPFEEQGRIVAAVKGLFLTITQIGHVIENQE